MKHKKEIHYLQDPSPDPFLINSDMEIDQLRKYHYLENEAYRAYKRREKRYFILIILVCLLLAGLAYWLMTVDPGTLEKFGI